MLDAFKTAQALPLVNQAADASSWGRFQVFGRSEEKL